ncbi:site-specific integrase [Hymenobacter guriensis]|uniref:Site-specific integrase n=1 Tax=Hymenobacter guriensis TaxID=2793065 RepID=A0ABS0L4E9_9BACT|nr:site-specific integrase [Hymenobacter guriensis]MBG8555011.1 site-specific integrase [Hymenobacter guriensis]
MSTQFPQPAAAHQVGPARSVNEFTQEAADYLIRSQQGAVNTQRAYAGDWQRFTTWCRAYDRISLPAEPATVGAFLVHLAREKKVSTVQRHLAAISKAHRLAKLPNPAADETVKDLLKGIALEKKVRPKQAQAFTLAHFKRVVQAIPQERPDGVRDRALLLLGFAGAFRRDELVKLLVEDLTFDDDGLLITLRESKTNQQGQAEEKAVVYSSDRRTCPVRALKDWLQVLETNGRHSGPVFLSFNKGQRLGRKRLSGVWINELVQRYLGAAYSAHSLRASFVTIAKLGGADDSKIMNQTKHKTTGMIRRYTRIDNVRQHNAVNDLGL